MKANKKYSKGGKTLVMGKYVGGGEVDPDKKKKIKEEWEAKKKANQEAAEQREKNRQRRKEINAQHTRNVASRVEDLNLTLAEYRALTPAERDGEQGAELRAKVKELRDNIRGGALPGVQVAPSGKDLPGVLAGGTAVERAKLQEKAARRGY